MRILSVDEQDLCQRIVAGNGNNNYLGNIIDNKLSGICIHLTRSQAKVELRITIPEQRELTIEENHQIVSKIQDISFTILTAVNLIRMLEREGYILLLQKANQLPESTQFGGCVEGRPFVYSGLGDENVTNLLVEYIDKEIIITDEFIQFCDHGFIGRDERRFRRQNLNSVLAISVAFFAALTNLYFNCTNRLRGTTINRDQVFEFKKSVDEIAIKIDTLIAGSKRTDSLKIGVLQSKQKSNSRKGKLTSHKN
jgi:hypothetical protein